MTSRRRTTSNQRWNNVAYVNVVIYNVVFFNVELNNVRQCRNNVVIFNVNFHNVGQRRNNVADMTIWKKSKPRFKNKSIFLNFKEYNGLNIFLHFFPILTLSWRKPLSYKNQSIDLQCKSMDWFLYDNGLRQVRVKTTYLNQSM